jgi:hypothetical protein
MLSDKFDYPIREFKFTARVSPAINTKHTSIPHRTYASRLKFLYIVLYIYCTINIKPCQAPF